MAGVTETAGQLAQIWIYPVKSMGGQSVDSALIEARGVAGDRAWSVWDTASGQTLSARRFPGLAQVIARTGDGDLVVLDIPGEPLGLSGPDADAALSRHLGRGVRLVRAAVGSLTDVAPVHLVSTAAVAAAAVSGQSCVPGGADDPRANLIVAVHDAPTPEQGPERDWVGRELVVGAAVLRISRTPKHCLGVYADVLRPGAASTGGAVRLRLARTADR